MKHVIAVIVVISIAFGSFGYLPNPCGGGKGPHTDIYRC